MTLTTSQRLSLWASLAVMLGFSAIYTLTSYFSQVSLNLGVFFITNLLIFPVSFIIYKFVLDKFIYEKIRPIYKTIHQFQAPRREQKNTILHKSDIIEKTNQEVMQWAQNKLKEVDELKKLEAYRREFLGNVSHELKTPIFNIQGYVLTLLDGGLDDPHINRKYLERAEKSIDRMISVIEDLEAISKFEAGEVNLSLSNFDLVALCMEVIDLMEIKAEKKNIRLQLITPPDHHLMVHADRAKIQQVLTNLIVNSIKYGVEKGRTRINFFDMDPNILVEITDNGMGIPSDDLPRVFERFYRGDRSRTRKGGEGGSGLGLAIVKHIVEAHNQTIHVRSALGEGSTFAFTLAKSKPQTTGLRTSQSQYL